MNQLSWETAGGYIWDGVHNSNNIVEQKANILLNLRCNSILMQKAQYPKGKTCCAIYPQTNRFQGVYLKLGLFILPPLAWLTSGM